MPQFELENIGPDRRSGVVRARTPEQAVRHLAGLHPDTPVELEKTTDRAGLEGWQVVRIDGRVAGRARAHHRMKFRRD